MIVVDLPTTTTNEKLEQLLPDMMSGFNLDLPGDTPRYPLAQSACGNHMGGVVCVHDASPTSVVESNPS